MIVFVINCNFFIVLPIQLKTCSSNDFFLFTRESVRARNIGRVSEVLRARPRLIASGAQFIQACNDPNVHVHTFCKHWSFI